MIYTASGAQWGVLLQIPRAKRVEADLEVSRWKRQEGGRSVPDGDFILLDHLLDERHEIGGRIVSD